MMNAITLMQPRAEQTMRAEHPVISHNFKPTQPGRILIHASRNREWLKLNSKETVDYPSGLAVAEMNFGEIIGAADVIDCVPRTRQIIPNAIQRKYPWLRTNPLATGPYVWILANLVRFAVPIPCGGQPGLWQYRGPMPPEEGPDRRPVSEFDLDDTELY